MSFLPAFSVRLDEHGQVAELSGSNVSISDEVLAQAVSLVLAQESDEGSLGSLDLRYLRQTRPDGLRIAFVHTGYERDSLLSLVATSLLVGAGGLTCFFFISLLLSSIALRPVRTAWEQQRQFVADASHELRTPLTVILTNSGILLSHPEDTVGSQMKWV
jgi:signal transduction histidine kinase